MYRLAIGMLGVRGRLWEKSVYKASDISIQKKNLTKSLDSPLVYKFLPHQQEQGIWVA